jgi:hypothetical protein
MAHEHEEQRILHHLEALEARSLAREQHIIDLLKELQLQGKQNMALSNTILALLDRLNQVALSIEAILQNGGAGGVDETALIASLTPIVQGLEAALAAAGGGGTGGGTRQISVSNASWDETRLALRSPSFVGVVAGANDSFDLASGNGANQGNYAVVGAAGDEIFLQVSIGSPSGTADISGVLNTTSAFPGQLPGSGSGWCPPGMRPGHFPRGQYPRQFPRR